MLFSHPVPFGLCEEPIPTTCTTWNETDVVAYRTSGPASVPTAVRRWRCPGRRRFCLRTPRRSSTTDRIASSSSAGPMSAAGAARNFSGPGAGAVGKLAATLFGAGAIAYGGYNSLFTCPGGHRAVMYNRVVGVKDAVYPEGMHFMIPWFETPTIFDVRTKPKKISSPTGTRDMQMVNISLRVLYKPDISQLPTIFRRFGSDYDDRILPSIVNETLKAVIAQYNASQLITKREQISREIRNHLQERAKDFYILLDDVSITHLSFGSEYTAAVESKQVAQQEAERAKFIVERALQDKRSNIIHAEGEAQSAEMIGKALARNPGTLQFPIE